jgi:hypothetical protein
LVENGDIKMQTAENLNADSLVRFHSKLSKFLQESKISPKPENQRAFYAKFE